MSIFNKLFKKDHYSPYCKSCQSCGEEGCCSPLTCAYKNMVKNKNKDCDYGKKYFLDLQFNYLLSKEIGVLIDNSKNKELIKKHDEIFDKIWHEVYDEYLG